MWVDAWDSGTIAELTLINTSSRCDASTPSFPYSELRHYYTPRISLSKPGFWTIPYRDVKGITQRPGSMINQQAFTTVKYLDSSMLIRYWWWDMYLYFLFDWLGLWMTGSCLLSKPRFFNLFHADEKIRTPQSTNRMRVRRILILRHPNFVTTPEYWDLLYRANSWGISPKSLADTLWSLWHYYAWPENLICGSRRSLWGRRCAAK